ncbi:MAG: RNA polymerase sigma factor [Candidatus Tumulicola sp.]
MGRWAPAEVIASAVTGNAIAVEGLLVAIWPACFRLATMVTGDRGLAEDAAQETCVIVHRRIRGLRRVDAFDAWLYRIVMHESAQVRRRAGQVAEATEQFTVSDGTMNLDVWRALGELSADLREVTVLFYFHGLKGEEIAAALRVSHGTVRTRLSRARQHLRALLGDYDFEPLDARLEVQHYAV